MAIRLRRYRVGSGDGSVNASIADLDTFIASRPGTLKQILFNTNLDSITDNVRATVAVSRSATADHLIAASGEGAQTQTIAEQMLCGNFVTSGLAQNSFALIVPCSDKLEIGDHLSVHFLATGTVVAYISIILMVEESIS